MTKELTDAFVGYIARCLAQKSTAERSLIEALVQKVLVDAPKQPTLEELENLQKEITGLLDTDDRIDLVVGGATKIKGYVFEAPKLPEIRGASTLLDWVNEVDLPKLWGASDRSEWYEKGIVYAGGGGFLAFAPCGQGEKLAVDIEQAYTKRTLTANSAAAAETFHLIELRYGRNPLGYWLDKFLPDWEIPARRKQLEQYYYGEDKDTPQHRFFRRKTFGELVTLLTLKASRRRDERAFDQGPGFYPRQPWDERCDSSDLRPAMAVIDMNDGADQLSAASARKVIAGRKVKEISIGKAKKLMRQISWKCPSFKSWKGGLNQRWIDHLGEYPGTRYASKLLELKKRPAQDKALGSRLIRPSHDVEEIGAASSRYIAMIYADGNNVGRLMATLATPQTYALVSRILSSTMEDAVFAGLARWLTPLKNPGFLADDRFEYIHPFEILSVGGDDLLLIVPGSYAFDIALTIAQNFEQLIVERLEAIKDQIEPLTKTALGTRSRYQRDRQRRDAVEPPDERDQQIDQLRISEPWLGLSAGVVVAPENTPIFFMNELVEELLKSAKKKASNQAKDCFPTAKLPPELPSDQHTDTRYYGGAIDFMVLKSITMVTDKIADFRKAALEHKVGEEQRRLYARPYAWHEMAGLLQTVHQLKRAHVPPSQLYRLSDTLEAALHGGLNPSVLEYLFTRTRMRGGHSDALANHVEHAWFTPGEGAVRLPPWMQREERKKCEEPATEKDSQAPATESDSQKSEIRQIRETIWLDMLEIYGLLEADKEPADGQD